MLELVVGLGGIVVGFLISLLFYHLSESNNERREKDRKKQESELPAHVEKFSWEDFLEGARTVGEFLFSEDKPDAILIFSGSSSIFSNLLLDLSLEREELLKARIYTGRFVSKDTPLDPALIHGYDVLDDGLARLRVLFPDALKSKGNRDWKIAVIDDTTTTGMSMQLIRSHLKALGYKNVKTASFTCVQRRNLNVENPIDFAYRYTTSNDFLFPWGRKPL